MGVDDDAFFIDVDTDCEEEKVHGEAQHSVPFIALCVCFQAPMNVNKSS